MRLWALVGGLLLCTAAAARAEEAAAGGSPVEQLFASIQQDGPLELGEAVRKQVQALLPSAGRGQCEKPAELRSSAVALRDRGDGALLIAVLASCQGEGVYAFAPGTPLRVARLFDNDEGRQLLGALTVPLRGGSGPGEEIGVVLAGQSTELRFFSRNSERGFAFAPSGALPDFSSQSSCEDGDADHEAGHRSLLRVGEPRNLSRLRLDARCGGGLSGARCEIWHVEGGQLERRGVCALPGKLDEADLKKAGWR